MPVKVVEEQQQDVPLREMKDGQIGVITRWSDPAYYGRTVQRYGTALVTIGQGHDRGWTGVCGPSGINTDQYRVRILPPGTLLEITE